MSARPSVLSLCEEQDWSVFVGEIEQRMDLLRSTADDLASGKINAFHAANRIRRIANEIAKEKK